MTQTPPPLTIEEAADYAGRVALMRYFPRRDPNAIAETADILRQVCSTHEQAEAVATATTQPGADVWKSAGEFRRFAAAVVNSLAPPAPAPRTAGNTIDFNQLGADEISDEEARQQIAALPTDQAAELRKEAADFWKDYRKQHPKSAAAEEPYLSRNIERLMLTTMRRRMAEQKQTAPGRKPRK